MLNLFFSHSPTPFLCPLKHPCSQCQRDNIRKNNCHLNLPEKQAKPPVPSVEFTQQGGERNPKHHLTWQVCSWEPRRMFYVLQTSTAIVLCFQRKPLQFWEVQGGIQRRHRALLTRKQEDRLQNSSLQSSLNGEKRNKIFFPHRDQPQLLMFLDNNFFGQPLLLGLCQEKMEEQLKH